MPTPETYLADPSADLEGVELFYARQFLNLERRGSSAHIIAEVGEEGRYLTLADCSRSVTLSFDHWDADERTNSLYKARALRDVVVEFVDALERWMPLAEEEERRREARRADAVTTSRSRLERMLERYRATGESADEEPAVIVDDLDRLDRLDPTTRT